jgi:peptidoglycan hydrolase CwlO-like protein
MDSLITLIVGVSSSSLLTAILASWLNRRKNKVDIADKIALMSKRLNDEQAEWIERLENKVEDLVGKIYELEAELNQAKQENVLLKARLEMYEKENEILLKRVEELDSKICSE